MQDMIDLETSQQQKTEHQTPETSLFRWKALEYAQKEKSREWFWSIGIIGAGAAIFSIIVGNFLFGIIIILVVFLLFMYEIQGPREYEFAITHDGVRIHNRVFEFLSLDSFWIFEYETGARELSIVSKKTFVPFIKLPLGDLDPDEVREILKKYIPEKQQEESLIDILARRIGF